MANGCSEVCAITIVGFMSVRVIIKSSWLDIKIFKNQRLYYDSARDDHVFKLTISVRGNCTII